MSKIMVTGGAGYIGSHTLIELIHNGYFTVLSVDNFLRSTPATFDRIERVTGQRVENYPVDICDRERFFQIFDKEKDITGVIHFAALKSVPESVEKPLEYYRNNLQSLENVLAACEEFSVPHFIFSSSCSIYGEVEKMPVSEETPVGVPCSPYAHTKQIGEEMIRFFAAIHPGLKSVMLRYFNPVGADMSGLNGELSPAPPSNLMPVIARVGIGKMAGMTVFGSDYDTRDGSCIRDYVHVSDIADAHVKALEFLMENRNKSNLEVFNLGSGEGMSVLEMVRAFESVTGVKLNYTVGDRRPGDVPVIYSNSGRAEREMRWKRKYSLEDMILSAWKWEQYVSHNE